VARKRSSYLRIHSEEINSNDRSEAQKARTFDIQQLMDDFTEATGWQPRALPATPHSQTKSGSGEERHIPLRERVELLNVAMLDGLLDAEDLLDMPMTGEDAAWQLLESIDSLVQRLNETEKALSHQEAKLATQVGVNVRSDEGNQLADRLLDALHRASELTSSDAAALYLLDDTTSELKMRCCWGMPAAALAHPPRNLRGALADLEALMGNAVLLENTHIAPEWNCPEPYAAAMCVPIGSPTMPHGTLWLFSEHIRDFSDSDIDAAKAATEKILSDIERSVLAEEVLKTRRLNRQFEDASLVQASRLPDLQPLHDDYELAGWTYQGQALGGNFHTWNINRLGQINAAMGDAATHGTAAALVATSVQTIVETCWNSNHKPCQVLRKANDILWGAQDGDWRSSLCYLQIHPESGSTQLSLAGDICAYVIGSRGYRMIAGNTTQLAVQPDSSYRNEQLYLEAGDLLMIASADVLAGAKRGGFSQDSLFKTIREMHDDPASDIADHLARMLPVLSTEQVDSFDRSLMLIRRRF
jgi:phosphoserine phosphatase RsbU/P